MYISVAKLVIAIPSVNVTRPDVLRYFPSSRGPPTVSVSTPSAVVAIMLLVLVETEPAFTCFISAMDSLLSMSIDDSFMFKCLVVNLFISRNQVVRLI